MREHLDETHPDAVLVSEWGNPEEALHAGFNMDFLLHFGPSHYLDLFREHPYFSAAADGDVKAFVDTYEAMLADTKGLGYICVPSGNHDMIRMRDTLTPDEMKLAFTFLLTLPGCPFIYYGDEIGMRYEHGLLSKEGGYERTGSRTPMQWDHTTNAGFSAARGSKLYLPIDPADDRPDAASQEGDATSLLETVRSLNALRLAHPALQADGAIEFLYAEDHAYPLVYARETGDERVVVAINTSGADASCAIPDDYAVRLADGHAMLTVSDAAAHYDNGLLHVPAGSATIFG